MKQLREEMKAHGYVPLEMKLNELPPRLISPKAVKYVKMRRAHLFSRLGDVEPTEAEKNKVRTTLDQFVQREMKNSKSAYFYPHPDHDPASPRTWIVVTQ